MPESTGDLLVVSSFDEPLHDFSRHRWTALGEGEVQIQDDRSKRQYLREHLELEIDWLGCAE